MILLAKVEGIYGVNAQWSIIMTQKSRQSNYRAATDEANPTLDEWSKVQLEPSKVGWGENGGWGGGGKWGWGGGGTQICMVIWVFLNPVIKPVFYNLPAGSWYFLVNFFPKRIVVFLWKIWEVGMGNFILIYFIYSQEKNLIWSFCVKISTFLKII